MRASLLERGIVLRQGRRSLAARVDAPPAAGEPDRLSPRVRLLVADMRIDWPNSTAASGVSDDEFAVHARRDEATRWLATVPGISPINATALVSAFGRARDLAAWLGLVPRQATTGGKPKLLGIIKRGSRYPRKNLIHGARAVMPTLAATDTKLGRWLRDLQPGRT